MLNLIKNNQQYEETLARIYMLLQKDIAPESKQADELKILSILVKEYENKQYPVPKPPSFEN